MVKKYKIGIVTFHRSHNCGSILQAYATQSILRRHDYEPEFIDFSTAGQKDLYSTLERLKFDTLSSFVKSIYRNCLRILIIRRTIRNWRSYDKYILNNLQLSAKSYNANAELIEDDMSYDKYLTGSDQVWNVTIADYDEAYFLNFVKKHPKIAYGVSQGARDISKYSKDVENVKSYISDIDFISTREGNGQKWLEALTGQKHALVLDPTLLLQSNDYAAIEEAHGLKGIEPDNYIFVYSKPLSREYMKIISSFARHNGLKIVLWHSDVWVKKLGYFRGVKCPADQTPGKYLDLMKNAKFVCTSSFHGVVFSTIYHKNFVVLENDGMRAGDDDRMTGFLGRVGLSSRIVDESTFATRMGEAVDYEEFGEKLKAEREESLKFLLTALG
ncbi:hypothetical protein B7Y92_00450 [Candidatus Saccharibacteria bacterium 32-50-13]|nr:MAG: hypothetical protein B7Y92_00450 [Candidatus Saccharibacteria bacterium 32-50-13]